MPAHQTFDYVGSLSFVIGLGSLLLALSLIAFPMLPMMVAYILFVVAVVALVGFVVVELRAKEPIIPLHLFRDRDTQRCWGGY